MCSNCFEDNNQESMKLCKICQVNYCHLVCEMDEYIADKDLLCRICN
jgi:hypothetical protein